MRANTSFDLSPFLEKGVFVILPIKQDSQFSIDSKSKESSTPSFWSLAMRFSFMCPRRQCHEYVSLEEAVFCLLSLRKISQSRFQCPSLRQWKHFLSSLVFLPTGLGATLLPFAFLFLFLFPLLGLFPLTTNTSEVLDFMYRGFMSLSNVLSIPKNWGMVLCM